MRYLLLALALLLYRASDGVLIQARVSAKSSLDDTPGDGDYDGNHERDSQSDQESSRPTYAVIEDVGGGYAHDQRECSHP